MVWNTPLPPLVKWYSGPRGSRIEGGNTAGLRQAKCGIAIGVGTQKRWSVVRGGEAMPRRWGVGVPSDRPQQR